jgi:hypothetical protein
MEYSDKYDIFHYPFRPELSILSLRNLNATFQTLNCKPFYNE